MGAPVVQDLGTVRCAATELHEQAWKVSYKFAARDDIISECEALIRVIDLYKKELQRTNQSIAVADQTLDTLISKVLIKMSEISKHIRSCMTSSHFLACCGCEPNRSDLLSEVRSIGEEQARLISYLTKLINSLNKVASVSIALNTEEPPQMNSLNPPEATHSSSIHPSLLSNDKQQQNNMLTRNGFNFTEDKSDIDYDLKPRSSALVSRNNGSGKDNGIVVPAAVGENTDYLNNDPYYARGNVAQVPHALLIDQNVRPSSSAAMTLNYNDKTTTYVNVSSKDPLSLTAKSGGSSNAVKFDASIATDGDGSMEAKLIAICTEASRFRYGHGCTKDSEKAFNLFSVAASDQGYGPAHTALGEMLLNNEVVRENGLKLAFKHFEQAGNVREEKACYWLYRMFSAGLGTSRDLGRSFYWLSEGVRYKSRDCFLDSLLLVEDLDDGFLKGFISEARWTTQKWMGHLNWLFEHYQRQQGSLSPKERSKWQEQKSYQLCLAYTFMLEHDGFSSPSIRSVVQFRLARQLLVQVAMRATAANQKSQKVGGFRFSQSSLASMWPEAQLTDLVDNLQKRTKNAANYTLITTENQSTVNNTQSSNTLLKNSLSLAVALLAESASQDCVQGQALFGLLYTQSCNPLVLNGSVDLSFITSPVSTFTPTPVSSSLRDAFAPRLGFVEALPYELLHDVLTDHMRRKSQVLSILNHKNTSNAAVKFHRSFLISEALYWLIRASFPVPHEASVSHPENQAVHLSFSAKAHPGAQAVLGAILLQSNALVLSGLRALGTHVSRFRALSAGGESFLNQFGKMSLSSAFSVQSLAAEEGLKLVQVSALAGSRQAHFHVALCAALGVGGPRDVALAVQSLKYAVGESLLSSNNNNNNNNSGRSLLIRSGLNTHVMLPSSDLISFEGNGFDCGLSAFDTISLLLFGKVDRLSSMSDFVTKTHKMEQLLSTQTKNTQSHPQKSRHHENQNQRASHVEHHLSERDMIFFNWQFASGPICSRAFAVLASLLFTVPSVTLLNNDKKNNNDSQMQSSSIAKSFPADNNSNEYFMKPHMNSTSFNHTSLSAVPLTLTPVADYGDINFAAHNHSIKALNQSLYNATANNDKNGNNTIHQQQQMMSTLQVLQKTANESFYQLSPTQYDTTLRHIDQPPPPPPQLSNTKHSESYSSPRSSQQQQQQQHQKFLPMNTNHHSTFSMSGPPSPSFKSRHSDPTVTAMCTLSPTGLFQYVPVHLTTSPMSPLPLNGSGSQLSMLLAAVVLSVAEASKYNHPQNKKNFKQPKSNDQRNDNPFSPSTYETHKQLISMNQRNVSGEAVERKNLSLEGLKWMQYGATLNDCHAVYCLGVLVENQVNVQHPPSHISILNIPSLIDNLFLLHALSYFHYAHKQGCVEASMRLAQLVEMHNLSVELGQTAEDIRNDAFEQMENRKQHYDTLTKEGLAFEQIVAISLSQTL